VLEVECGNGINLLSLAGHFPEAAFTGIDETSADIDAAKAIQAKDSLPPHLADYIPLELTDAKAFTRIAFEHGNAASLPFADDEFDLVFTVLAADQLDRIRDQALAEIVRVTRGYVLLLEPFRDANMKGVRRLFALSRNYVRGSIQGLARFGLEPIWATEDFPQEAFVGSPLVLAQKVKA
jgi:ubiquinone/menaquinone biosynthesis C-methylase UbiE